MRLRPLPDGSLGALGLPVRLLLPSLSQRVSESFSLSAWSFPFSGLSPFSRLFLCWRPCRSRSLIPFLAPSWWWPCPLLRWALLTLSGYVLSVPSAVSLHWSRCSIPSHCRSSCTVSLLTVSVIGARFAFARGGGGVTPCVWSCRCPSGVAVAPPLSPYTGPGWSLPICCVPLELRSVFYVFLCDIPHVFMAINLSVSLTPACSLRVIPIRGCSLDTCKASAWLDLLSSSSLFQDSCHLR